MSLLSSLLLLQAILIVYGQQRAGLKCAQHQVLDPCATPCPPTCRRPNPPVCNSLRCQPGCVCTKGLLWNEETKECIPLDRCPKQCGRNAEWSECGAACRLTCQNRDNLPICPASRVCQRGCVCRSGFILENDTGKCVPENSCPGNETVNYN